MKSILKRTHCRFINDPIITSENPNTDGAIIMSENFRAKLTKQNEGDV